MYVHTGHMACILLAILLSCIIYTLCVLYFICSNNYDDLRDVKYFPMSDSQKSQSPPNDTQNQNQEPQVTKASEYDFPVFTSVEHNPQVTGYDSLSAKTAKYDNPDGILNPNSQSDGPPVDNLYDPLTLESVVQSDDVPKSPVVEYDKLMHSPTPQGS